MFSCLSYGNEPIGQAGKRIVDGPQKDIWCPSCSLLSSHLDLSVPRGYAHSMSGHIKVIVLHFFIKLYIFLCFSSFIFFYWSNTISLGLWDLYDGRMAIEASWWEEETGKRCVASRVHRGWVIQAPELPKLHHNLYFQCLFFRIVPPAVHPQCFHLQELHVFVLF